VLGIDPEVLHCDNNDATHVLGHNVNDLLGKLAEADNQQSIVCLLNDYLRQSLMNHQVDRDYLHMALNHMRTNNGLLNMETLYDMIPISPRQLQRSFKAIIGLSPKEYNRIIRFNTITRYMQSTNKPSLRHITFDAGYADQSHLTREFSRFAGASPGNFLRNKDKYISNPIGD